MALERLNAIADTSTPQGRRSGARRGRLSRHNAPCESTPFTGRKIPVYDLLDETALARIEDQADWILSNIGVEFRGDRTALDHFAQAGARIDGERVRFEPGHVRALCATAPSAFQLHARDPAKTVTLGGNNVVLMPGYGSPFVSDLAKGRRYATLEDCRNFVKLSYSSPALHHSGGTVVEPTDIPVNKRWCNCSVSFAQNYDIQPLHTGAKGHFWCSKLLGSTIGQNSQQSYAF